MKGTVKQRKKGYTVAEAARKLGISRQAVHDAINAGRLKAEKGEIVQTVTLIPEPALKAYRVSLSHKRRASKRRS